MTKQKTKRALLLSTAAILMFAAVLSFSLTSGSALATLDDADVIEIAGEAISAEQLTAIKEGFAAKEQGLSLTNPGGITTAREIIMYQDYNSSARLVYNFAEEDYFLVSAEYYTKYIDGDNFRRLGAPTTDKGTFNVSGRTRNASVMNAEYTAQIFEKGVLLTNGAEVVMHVGAVEKTVDGYVLHPVVDDQDVLEKDGDGFKYFGCVDGELHPLKSADIISETVDDETQYKLYANYRSCCVYVQYDAEYRIIGRYVYAARNFHIVDGNYETALLPKECINVNNMLCDGASPVDANALEYYQSVDADGTEESLIKLFADCYEGLLEDGYAAGYRCSRFKMWTYLVVDLKFGDGTTGFDEAGSGDRERMTILVYSPEDNKVFPVYGAYFTMFKVDEGVGRETLGYPRSTVYKNKTIGGKTFKEIQFYKNGYVYLSDSNFYMYELGYGYDAEDNTFVPIASPTVIDRYGKELARKTSGESVYINYEYGAVKCDLTANKTKYHYTYFGGRNFDFNDGFKAKLFDTDVLLIEDDLTSTGTMPRLSLREISFDDVIKPLIYDKYERLYEGGFFCGYIEANFKSWNGVYAQQFIGGDSNSLVFYYDRPNVAALVYNPKTEAVYLLKDEVMTIWHAEYATAGAPTSDEHQVEGSDLWFQTFDYGMTIRSGSYIIFTEEFESPAAYVSEANANKLGFPTHGGDQQSGYIG